LDGRGHHSTPFLLGTSLDRKRVLIKSEFFRVIPSRILSAVVIDR